MGYSYFAIMEPFVSQGQRNWSKYADYEYINELFSLFKQPNDLKQGFACFFFILTCMHLNISWN